jgi:hypothetical protein
VPFDPGYHARRPTTRDEAELRRLEAANESAYDRIRSMGGTLYPVSAFATLEEF